MYLCQVSYQPLVSANFITYGYLLPKSNIRLWYSYQLLFCNYSFSLFQITSLSATITCTISVFLLHRSCSGYSLQVLLSTIFISYSFLLVSATLISYL